ncbi:Uncharacterized protein TCM_044423 [Theobroma cacao]|uniref:Uncharacterized protein n=1 Tax=Theobroma cacao TaxID=3641 RepID=A0A061FPW0_THECC|nr:Uncharacterized protein TCM_044423 [Theobroma cacao]
MLKTVGKLNPLVRKCGFVGYAPTHKGYKCYDPRSKKMETYIGDSKCFDIFQPKNAIQSINTTFDGLIFFINTKPKLKPQTNQNSTENPSNLNTLANSKLAHFEFSMSDLDIPIANCKGIRTCTKYPIANFVSYKNMSPTFFMFTSQLSCVEIPKIVQNTLKVSKWKMAILKEMRALEKNKTYEIAILIMYVDDIILIGDDTIEIERLQQYLASEFKIKDSRSQKYFLGMEVARSKKGIAVSQMKYVIDLLKETSMSGCRPAETPVDPNQKLGDSKGNLMNTLQYQKLVRKLIYLSYTWPDIAFEISLVSQFMHSPHEEHLEAVYRILRYLKSSPRKDIPFHKSNVLVKNDSHFIKEKIEGGAICNPFVPTSQQIADILTKGLLIPNYEFLINKLGMIDIYVQLEGKCWIVRRISLTGYQSQGKELVLDF